MFRNLVRVLLWSAFVGTAAPVSAQVPVAALGPTIDPHAIERLGITARAVVAAIRSSETVLAQIDSALRFARDSGEATVAAWQLYQGYPSYAAALSASCQSGSTSCPVDIRSALLAVSYAGIAANDNTVNDLLKKMPPADTAAARSDLRALLSQFQADQREYIGAPQAWLYASGDVRGVATGTDKATTATGSLGIRVESANIIWQTTIAVASTSDTLQSGFGAAVLTPGAGQSRGAGLTSFIVRLPQPGEKHKWLVRHLVPPQLHLYGSIARSTWADTIHSPLTPKDTVAEATAFGAGVLARARVACCQVVGNPVTLDLEAGPSFRWISGDVASRDSLRSQVLNTSATDFWGFETGVQLTVGKVSGTLQTYYMFPHRESKRVDGLTHLQLVTAFTIDAEIFHGPLTP